MTTRLLVQDRRLEGNAPDIAQHTYLVDETNSTNQIIQWIGTHVRTLRGVDELLIMSHGMSYQGASDEEVMGSAGIQLGSPGLYVGNVAKTIAWKPHISRIYLYVCRAAMPSASGDSRIDGSLLCSKLAMHSGAQVFASSDIQEYDQNISRWEDLTESDPPGTIDFGRWEGDVFGFNPNTGRRTPMTLRGHRQPPR